MSWIGLINGDQALFRADGLARLGTEVPVDDLNLAAPMSTGSLVIETRASPYDRPQMLLGVEPRRSGGIGMVLQAVPGGGIVLILTRNGETFHAAANLDTGGRIDVLRVTYSWDSNANIGRIAVEFPGTHLVALRDLESPLPLSLLDVQQIVCDPNARVLSGDLSYVAFSNKVEPIGPMPTLCLDTPVMTPSGYVAAGEIKRGDVVQASNGSYVPVLNTVHRTVPAVGLFAPIELRAPFFGLSKRIAMGCMQRLVIGGSRVEYMFGSEFVLVPAGNLLHGNAAQYCKPQTLTTYCQLILPDHEAVLAAGTYLETLDLGRIRRKRDVLRASLFVNMPRAELPEHSRTAYPVLREFDALTLAAQRVA